VIAVGGVVFAVLMALAGRYGFDRDKLYFLDAARHLQASYVDQPVLAPLLAWVSLHLFGVFLPLFLPVLPPADIGWNPDLRETVGWPQLVRTVDAVWTSLPPGQRARAVIFTDDYGEAGAINELGRGMGLPTAVSSQNSEW